MAQVVKKVYADAQSVDWEHLTQVEHTEWYGRWLNDDIVGGILTQWMNTEDARVWLKDGPMKEYARALAGEGSFAKYLDEHPRAPSRIVAAALGPEWLVVRDSVRVKPLRCRARKGEDFFNVYWGPFKDFKYLLWAALLAKDERALIVVWDAVANPIPEVDKNTLLAIGQRCTLLVRFIRL